MDRVLVYSLGRKWACYRDEIRTAYEVVGVTDRDEKKGESEPDFIRLDRIQEVEYDYILIPTSNPTFINDVTDFLKEIGISNSRIKSYESEKTDKIENERKLISGYARLHDGNRTSVSDSELYPEFCLAAACDDAIFQGFRNSMIYTNFVEHADRHAGEIALKQIEDMGGYSRKEWEIILENDRYGTPRTGCYSIDGGVTRIGHNTLCYAAIMKDIFQRFDFTNGEICRVGEIGVGYGAQGRMICACCDGIKEYVMIDLPEVIMLASKYVSKYNTDTNFRFIDGTKEAGDEDPLDLIISNYAFSELMPGVQEKYMKEWLLKSRRGYMIWNDMSYCDYEGYSLDDLVKLLPNVKISTSELIAGATSRILTWEKERGM